MNFVQTNILHANISKNSLKFVEYQVLLLARKAFYEITHYTQTKVKE